MLTVLHGDALSQLAGLADESVQCVVTSPPFWGLRDYGLPPIIWPDTSLHPDDSNETGDCSHEWITSQQYDDSPIRSGAEGVGFDDAATTKAQRWREQSFCKLCGAWSGCLGLEPTPELYVQHIVDIFRELKRVLRKDGTLWLNLGDSYSAQAGQRKITDKAGIKQQSNVASVAAPSRCAPGLKPKDLVGIPWRVALALQADGWYLRSDIIWAKTNCMPEAVTDRPTKSHEYIFLLTKSGKYFYDAVAIQEESSNRASGNKERKLRADYGGNSDLTNAHQGFAFPYEPDGVRNKRTVWTIPTATFPDAHFATFPVDLVIPCILAGTSARGACPICAAPWERITKREDQGFDGSKYGESAVAATGGAISGGTEKSTLGSPNGTLTARIFTSGWRTTCSCMKDYWEKSGASKEWHTGEEWKDILDLVAPGFEPEPCVVLDPFGGSGTTGKVAIELGRQAILIEPKAEYCEMIEKRCATNIGLPM